VSAETRNGNWQKLWPGLAVSMRNSEREAGETAVWLAGRVADLPEETQREKLLELLQMTGLTVSAE
jgi:hypothetical protein